MLSNRSSSNFIVLQEDSSSGLHTKSRIFCYGYMQRCTTKRILHSSCFVFASKSLPSRSVEILIEEYIVGT